MRQRFTARAVTAVAGSLLAATGGAQAEPGERVFTAMRISFSPAKP